MKIVNKSLIKEKNFLISKKFKRILLCILIFFIGILFERFDLKIKFYDSHKEFISIISDQFFSSNNDLDKIIIDIKYKNYLKIKEERSVAIKNIRANEDLFQWVPAKIKFNNKNYKVKIKLKGTHSDHWSHPKKWSFKIKLLNDNYINGFSQFSIQQPKTREFLYEWLFMKVLKNEKLIYHRNSFVNLQVNGDNLGIYYLDEFYSKQLIENNNRREGPILGWDKSKWIEDLSNLSNLGANFFEDSFLRAQIKPTQFKDNQIGTIQEIYLKDAISLLEAFKKKELKLKEIFDVEKLAKLMAIKVVFGSSEFDWRDIKFYYNPITSLLEPIGKEVHVANQLQNTLWWIDDNNLNNVAPEQLQFINLLIKDKNFYNLFLNELNRMIDKDYLSQIIKDNDEEFNKFFKILEKNFLGYEIFSFNHLEKIQKFVQGTLNPNIDIEVFLLGKKNYNILFSLQNLQSLPVEILSLNIEKEKINYLDNIIFIAGKKYLKPAKSLTFKINCINEINCKEILDRQLNIEFRIVGTKKSRFKKINKIYKNKPNLKKTINSINDYSNLPYLSIDYQNKIINFEERKIIIDNPIIIPENYTVNFLPGCEIIFSKNGHIISYSALNIVGSKNKPIVFSSSYDPQNQTDQNNGFGIFVLNSKDFTNIENVIFKNLYSPDLKLGYGLMGPINLYNTNVKIRDSKFIDNKSGDDYLNIINSYFDIKNVSFFNSKFDSIDLDFSKGVMDNIFISNSGNDGIDFSGTEAKLKNISINQTGDKAISVGEKSLISINNLNIKKSKIGIASKDLSIIEIDNLQIQETEINGTAYQKKPEYGPGQIKITRINQDNNSEKFLTEQNSKIFINDKLLPIKKFSYDQL